MLAFIEIRKNPFIRIVIPFIAGVLLISNIQDRNIQLLTLLIGLFFSLVLWSIRYFKLKQPAWISGVLIYLVLAVTGMGAYYVSVSSVSLPMDKMNYCGIVYSLPVKNKRSVSIDCMLTGVEGNIRIHNGREKVRLYLPANSNMDLLHIGDSIYFKGELKPLRNSGNPGEFDYSSYMHNQGITYSGFVREKDFRIGDRSNQFTFRRLASNIQKHIIHKMEEYRITGDGLAVLTALVAGDRQFLDGDLKESFAAAGVMHILAVSGLHVGILYLFLSMVLFRNNNKLVFRVFRLIIILSAIWGYAFITGLSSSVLRASVMFTLFLVGKNVNRPVSSYNILAASALIILVFDPLQLFRVGFQFSYIAVFGIIFFQPRIENLLLIKNPLFDRVWQLVTVSIAAQITTFPLTLYYFHQFPVYFWLSNIIVIPAVWLIMITALLFLIFSAVVPIASFLAICLKGLLFVLNQTVDIISYLPFAVIENIRFQCHHLIGFILILLALIFIHSFYRLKRTIYFLLAVIPLILITDIVNFRLNENKSELILYKLRNSVAISIIDGHKHMLIVESNNADWHESKEYLKSYWIDREIEKNLHEYFLDSFSAEGTSISIGSISIVKQAEGFYLSLNNQFMLLLSESSKDNLKLKSSPIYVDMLLVTGESGFPQSYHHKVIYPEKLVLLGKLSNSLKKAWKKFAVYHGIEIYSIYDSGALHKIY